MILCLTIKTNAFDLICRYNVVGQYYEVGEFLQGVSILTLVLYFVTSSDSGSLVVDTLASNGRHEQNPLQRLLWAAVEGTLYWL
jgi:choline-glycine betaine transporter